MPHEPGHNGQYVIKSTGEPYNGPVLKTQSGESYTTTTGAMEGHDGFSIGGQLLVLASESTTPPLQQQTAVGDDNPITRLFTAPTTPRYYLPNGNLVNIGARLHQHQDGTVMTEHSMGANDNSVVVTTVPSNGSRNRTNGLSQTAGRRTRTRTGRQQTRTQQQNRMNQNQTTTRRTSASTRTGGTMNTRRRTSGGSGGGGGY